MFPLLLVGVQAAMGIAEHVAFDVAFFLEVPNNVDMNMTMNSKNYMRLLRLLTEKIHLDYP